MSESEQPRQAIAAVYAVQRDKEAACHWLQEAVDAGSFWVDMVEQSPFFENTCVMNLASSRY